MSGKGSAPPAQPAAKGRCRCGHLPTFHLVVRLVATGAFGLVPAGPCSVCGEAGCHLYAPGGT